MLPKSKIYYMAVTFLTINKFVGILFIKMCTYIYANSCTKGPTVTMLFVSLIKVRHRTHSKRIINSQIYIYIDRGTNLSVEIT